MRCLYCNAELEIEENTCSCPNCGTAMSIEVYGSLYMRLIEVDKKIESAFNEGQAKAYETVLRMRGN